MPRPTYFFAIETTSRRFASVSWRFASSPESTSRVSAEPSRRASSSPASMRMASDFSCSMESSGTRPISLRYMRTGSSSERPSGIVSSASSSRSASGFSSFCSSASSMPAAASLFEELVELLGADLFEHVESGVDLFIGQRALALSAREQLLLQFFERDRRAAASAHCAPRLSCVPSFCSFTSFPVSFRSIVSTSRPSASNSPRSSSETVSPLESRSSIRSRELPIPPPLVVEPQTRSTTRSKMRAPFVRVAVTHRGTSVARARAPRADRASL